MDKFWQETLERNAKHAAENAKEAAERLEKPKNFVEAVEAVAFGATYALPRR